MRVVGRELGVRWVEVEGRLVVEVVRRVGRVLSDVVVEGQLVALTTYIRFSSCALTRDCNGGSSDLPFGSYQ